MGKNSARTEADETKKEIEEIGSFAYTDSIACLTSEYTQKMRLRDFLRAYLRLKRDAIAAYKSVYRTQDFTKTEIEKRACELLALHESQAFLMRVEKDALLRYRVDDDELLRKARDLLDDFEQSEKALERVKLLDQVCKMTAFYTRAEEKAELQLSAEERRVQVILTKNTRYALKKAKGITIEEDASEIAEDGSKS